MARGNQVEHSAERVTPLVTAIVVNWNGGEALHACLDSLFRQSYSRLAVILVDNASVDGSADAAVRRHGARLKLIQNGKNEGFAKANNQAIRVAQGEWVFLLNCDAVADARAIAELMSGVAAAPEIGMLACRVKCHDAPAYFDSVGLLLYPDGVCRPRGWQEKDLGQYDRCEEVLAPHGAAAAYRKAMLDDIGLFDEAYFSYLEDLDLGMRGQLCGWRCWYVPSAIVLHRKSLSTGNYSKFKAYHVERNRIWNAVKLMPRFILLVSPLFTLNRYLLQGYAAATHRGISGEFVKEYSYLDLAALLVKAYAAALLRLPEMLAKRRAIARKRRLTTEQWYRLISRYKLDAIELALKF
jgi:GT2 family glycosyltransferase